MDIERPSSGDERPGTMMSRQKELPRLPVAPLHESLTRYLESLEPLLSQTELDHAREVNTVGILQQLLRVVEMSPKADVGIGILTTEHRDVWAESYKRLCQDSKNAACVEAIRKAVLALCLDRPLNSSEPYEVACPQQMFLGGRDGENAANRWCDKSLQFIVGEEGYSALLSDHSPMDGPVVTALVDHCYDYMFRDELDVLIYKFQNYGKDFVKSRNMSPDSFVQMALQLAFYKIHNVPCAMYESVSTREFLHGRTEGVRGTSSQSLNFCRTFESPHSTREQKEHSLRKAVAKHKHDANLFARVDNVELRPFTWVFDGSPASQLAQRRGPGRPRTPLSSRGTDLPFLPPRFTFCRGQSVGGIGTCEHLAVAGTSRRRDGRNCSTGGLTGVAPLQTRASSREGCCCSLSSGDEDFETADSFFTDCFDEVPRNSVQATAGLPDVGNTERSSSAPGVDARPSQGRDRPKPALQRLASMDLGVDSLGNLTNLELLARQWRTSVMLRKIWRRSERRARSSRE
ncbi:carnitine O-acetyltransferase-like [Ixodes scapularis]